MAVLVTWLSNSKSHMRSRGILVTFSENGRQHGFVSHNSAVPLERFDQTFTFRIAPVLKHVHSSRTQLFKAILSRTSCAVTLMSHDNARVSKATQEFTPFRCHIFPYVNRTAISHMRYTAHSLAELCGTRIRSAINTEDSSRACNIKAVKMGQHSRTQSNI